MGNFYLLKETDMNRTMTSRDYYFVRLRCVSAFLFIMFFHITGCHGAEHIIPPSPNDTYYLSPNEIAILNEKVKHGDMEAAEKLSNYYSFSEVNYTKANKFLRIIAKSGDARGQHNLASVLIQSSSSEERKEAVYWYEMSAKKGFVLSQSQLARLYECGEIVKQDYCKAKYWYEKAARSGEANSMVKMSKYLEEGKCNNRDYMQAYAWLLVVKKQVNPQKISPNSLMGKEIIEKLAFFKKQLSESEIKHANHEYEKLSEEIEASSK
jgi:hypothetical protein